MRGSSRLVASLQLVKVILFDENVGEWGSGEKARRVWYGTGLALLRSCLRPNSMLFGLFLCTTSRKHSYAFQVSHVKDLVPKTFSDLFSRTK